MDEMAKRIKAKPQFLAVLQRVHQDSEGVTLQFDTHEARVHRAILTLPPPALEQVVFEPALNGKKRCAVVHARQRTGRSPRESGERRSGESAEEAANSNSGYPVYMVSDIASQEAGNQVIPVEQPRIYYGEVIADTDADYAIVGGSEGSDPREYDTDTSRYTYTGSGGVPIGNWFNRLAFAAKYTERNILFSGAIGSDSKISGDAISDATCVPWPLSSSSGGSMQLGCSHGPSTSPPFASTGMSWVKLRLSALSKFGAMSGWLPSTPVSMMPTRTPLPCS